MSASITLAEALAKFRRVIGCIGDDALLDLITENVEWLMLNGGGKILREWIVPIQNGNFTFPRDLETPVKYKLGRSANAGFGVFNAPALSFGSQGIKSTGGYYDWDGRGADFAIASTTNRAFTQFYPPRGPYRLLATTKDPNDAGKKIQVMGKYHNLQVAPMHFDEKTAGEVLTVYLENDPNKKYGAYQFEGPLNGVVRDATESYGQLWAVDCKGNFCFLAHYYPDDEHPVFQAAQVFGRGLCPDQCIHVLGRVNPTIRYTRNEDVLPIASPGMLDLLSKRARYDSQAEYEQVGVMEVRLRALIKQWSRYQGNTSQLSVNLKSTGYTYSNI